MPPTPGQGAVGALQGLTLPLGHSCLSAPRAGDPSSHGAPGARVNTRRVRRICSATLRSGSQGSRQPPPRDDRDRSPPMERTTDLGSGCQNTLLLETRGANSNQWSAAAAGVGAREARPRVVARWSWDGLQVALGCARGGRRWPRGGSRRAPLAAVPGPETAAPAKVTQRPALTHSQERPRGLARKVPLVPGRAASVSPVPSRARRGRGQAERVVGRARLPVEGDGALLPFALPVGAVRGRAADHHLGPRAAAPPPGSGPRLVAPSPERDRPEGRRAATRLRDVGASPRGAVRQDGGARLPAAGRRPSARPGSRAPRVSGTQRGSARVSRLWGVSRGTRAGGPYSDMTRRPGRTARWPRLRVRAHGGLTSSPRGLSARLRLLPPPRWVVAGLLGERAGGRRGAERTRRTLRAGLLRTSTWQPAHIRAHFRPRPRPGLALAAARRVALRTRRTDAVFSRRPEKEDGRR